MISQTALTSAIFYGVLCLVVVGSSLTAYSTMHMETLSGLFISLLLSPRPISGSDYYDPYHGWLHRSRHPDPILGLGTGASTQLSHCFVPFELVSLILPTSRALKLFIGHHITPARNPEGEPMLGISYLGYQIWLLANRIRKSQMGEA